MIHNHFECKLSTPVADRDNLYNIHDTFELIPRNIIKVADNLEDKVEQSLIQRLLQAFICEKLLPYSIKDNTLYISLKRLKKTIVAHNVQSFNLEKFKIHGKIILIEHHEWVLVKSIRSLLDLIYLELADIVESDKWNILVDEIENCLTNDILVKKFIKQLNRELSVAIKKSACCSFIEYIHTHYSAEGKLIFFESWATRGHPYHPCHKTKLGFSRNDYLNYSPEFNRDINLPLVAIDRSLMHYESEKNDSDYNSWFATMFPQQWNDFQKKLKDDGLSENDYYPIFVHPWQLDNKILLLFHSLIDSKKLILFRNITLSTKPSLSFRTLIVKDDSQKPHIKIPVAVHSTSTLRINPPASVENGPRLTKILKKIFIQENQLDQHLKLAYEPIGLHIKHSDPNIIKHLGIIYRENPINLVAKNQIPVVVAALYEKSPVNDLPLFLELMHSSMGDDLLASAITYFENYCRIVIRPYLNLLLIYGISLEGHQQNTIAVFENRSPVFMIARDLSGLIVHVPTLQKKGFHFEAYPHSETITNDRAEATNQFLHTVIQYHLGEIVLLLAQHYSTSENTFWKIIRNIIYTCFHELKNKIDADRWQQEYNAILEEDWQVKGLLRMRLNNLSKKYIYINHRNPLRDL